MSQLAHAERSVCGAVFLDPTIYEQSGLRYEHFHDPKLSMLWEVMGRLRAAGKPIDPITVGHELKEDVEAFGGLSALSALAVEVPVTSNAAHYAAIVREHWLTRQIVQLSGKTQEMAKGGTVGDELLDILGSGVNEILRHTDRNTDSMYDVVLEQLGLAAETYEPKGLPSGFGLEKWVPGGFPRDKVSVIFADEGTFKTTVKNHIIMAMAKAGHRVLDMSLEDSEELTAHRIISQETGIPYGRIEGGVLNDAERQVLKKFDPRKLDFTANIISGDTIAPNMKDIVRNAQQHKYNGGLDAVVIDYIQILDGRTKADDQLKSTIDEAMRQAQLAAKRHKIAFIFLSQRKQDARARRDPRPIITDPLGSSNIKNGAKLVVGLFRPSNVWKNPTNQYRIMSRTDYEKVLEAWILKNVVGMPKKAINMMIDPPTGRIETLEGINE